MRDIKLNSLRDITYLVEPMFYPPCLYVHHMELFSTCTLQEHQLVGLNITFADVVYYPGGVLAVRPGTEFP